MRYLIAVLAIACLASSSDACGGKLFSRFKSRPIVKATAAVATAPVKAVRTIVCNGQTCTVVK